MKKKALIFGVTGQDGSYLAEFLLKKNYDFRICVELPIKAKRMNFNYISLPSYERSRIGGKKKVNAIKDGLLILFEMVRLFFIKK